MRILIMKILLTVLLVCVVSTAYGMVYTWTDSAGVSHFTNKEYEIPTRYKAKTKSLYPEQTDTTISQTGQIPQERPEVRPLTPTQPAKHDVPEEPTKTSLPVITPDRHNKSSDWSSRGAKRTRRVSPREE